MAISKCWPRSSPPLTAKKKSQYTQRRKGKAKNPWPKHRRKRKRGNKRKRLPKRRMTSPHWHPGRKGYKVGWTGLSKSMSAKAPRKQPQPSQKAKHPQPNRLEWCHLFLQENQKRLLQEARNQLMQGLLQEALRKENQRRREPKFLKERQPPCWPPLVHLLSRRKSGRGRSLCTLKPGEVWE